jgi:catalase
MAHKVSLKIVALPFVFGLFATVAAAEPAGTATPEQIVDALNGVFGKHPGARAVHAKGVIVEGDFTPSPSAASLSAAPHFHGGAVPVTVRFSNFAGVPNIPDNDPLASPHGMAVKFHLAGGDETNIVAHSFNGFPVANSDDFRDLLIALGTSGKDAPKPTPLDTFLGGHPIAKAFLEAPKPPPVSFASLPYYGVNAFKFTNAKGESVYIRYQILPLEGAKSLSKEDAEKAAPDYLVSEIVPHVEKTPAKFKLVAQVAEKGDKIDDPSIAWPDSRKLVELGVIEIKKGVADQAAASKANVFMPGVLTKGIEAADPMIEMRDNAYAVSFSRRSE